MKIKYANEEKTTCNIINDNGTILFMSVENDAIKKYIEDGVEIEEAHTEAELQAKEISEKLAEATKYLSDTDWYVVRYTETGKEIPEDVRIKRQECRDFL